MYTRNSRVLLPMFRRRINYPLFAGFGILLLLLVLIGWGSLSSKGEKYVPPKIPSITSSPVQTRASIPVCSQPVCLAPATAPGLRRFIDTWNNIHRALIFAYNLDNAAQVAKSYDFVWGANVGTDSGIIASLRAGNPNIYLSYYISLNRDSGSFDNLGLAGQHDLNYWKSLHPDWILYKCDRTTPAFELQNPNMPFDMTNNDFINWQVQSYAVPASQAGYDAIAADNLNLYNAYGACGSYHNGKWVQRYTGQLYDPQWEKDMLYWVTQMQQKLHALPHPLALIPNIGYRLGSAAGDPQSAQIVQQIVDHVDGVLDEGGFTQYGSGYLTDNDWIQTIQLIRQTQQQNKPYYIIDEFLHQPSRADAQWAISSYLMCKEHLSALFYSSDQGYGSDINYPEYGAQIGRPVSDMYPDQGVYWRNYSGGVAIANPSSTQTYTINLNTMYIDASGFVDFYGTIVGQTLTLGPHTGIVLLRKH